MNNGFGKEVRIPVWVITAFLIVGVALSGFMWKQIGTQSQIIEQVERLRIDLDLHIIIIRDKLDDKANQREVDRIYDTLRRIESKMDNLTEN